MSIQDGESAADDRTEVRDEGRHEGDEDDGECQRDVQEEHGDTDDDRYRGCGDG